MGLITKLKYSNKVFYAYFEGHNKTLICVCIRKNADCSNKYRSNTVVEVVSYKNQRMLDSEITNKLTFNNYLDFKVFKDLFIKNKR